MMKRRLMIAACVITATTIALLSSPRRVAACSYDAAPFARMPRHAYLIIVPTSRLVSSAGRLPPRFANLHAPRAFDEDLWQPGRLWWWQARITRWFHRLRDRPPYGQVARLEHVGGKGSPQLARTRHVVIVSWNTSSTCGDELRPARTPALPVDERLFLTATMRDSTHWISGLPTFDMAIDHFSHYDRDYGKPPADRRQQHMGAREVLSAYEALPAYEDLRHQESAAALAPLRAWARAHPTLAAQDPAQRMIANATRFALYADSVRLGLHPYQTRLPDIANER